MIHGVCCSGGRGIPEKVKIEQKTKKDKEFKAQGTLKAVICTGDPSKTDIVCACLYNVKSFYMMSTVVENLTWKKKTMGIYCTKKRMKVDVSSYRLNLADNHDKKMGRADVEDQFRNYYQSNYWMRERKRWWSFLM